MRILLSIIRENEQINVENCALHPEQLPHPVHSVLLTNVSISSVCASNAFYNSTTLSSQRICQQRFCQKLWIPTFFPSSLALSLRLYAAHTQLVHFITKFVCCSCLLGADKCKLNTISPSTAEHGVELQLILIITTGNWQIKWRIAHGVQS